MDKMLLYGQEIAPDAMNTIWAGRTVRFYECTDSTNARAKMEAENGAENGMLVVADMQTAGRGRRGRSWESPAGSNIYFTLLLKPDIAPERASMLTLVMALAVVKGIEDVLPEGPAPMIKWPNDVVMNGKKVCGILTEMTMKRNAIDYVLIGVGINVFKQEFAPELVEKATSIEAESRQELARTELLVHIIKAFEEYYEIFREKESLAGLRTLYNQKLVNCEREVCVLDPKGEYRGVATGINDTGELCVTLPDGSMTRVYAGEVSVRGIYGYV